MSKLKMQYSMFEFMLIGFGAMAIALFLLSGWFMLSYPATPEMREARLVCLLVMIFAIVVAFAVFLVGWPIYQIRSIKLSNDLSMSEVRYNARNLIRHLQQQLEVHDGAFCGLILQKLFSGLHLNRTLALVITQEFGQYALGVPDKFNTALFAATLRYWQEALNDPAISTGVKKEVLPIGALLNASSLLEHPPRHLLLQFMQAHMILADLESNSLEQSMIGNSYLLLRSHASIHNLDHPWHSQFQIIVSKFDEKVATALQQELIVMEAN